MASVAPAPHPHAGLPSAFAAAAAAGWDTPSAHTTATATPATGSDGGSVHSGLWPSRTPSGALEHARSAPLQPKRSLGLQRVTSDPTSQLWRTSTAVTERAASLGFTSVESLCGSAYVPAARLSKFKPLGEGAFAGARSAWRRRRRRRLPPPALVPLGRAARVLRAPLGSTGWTEVGAPPP